MKQILVISFLAVLPLLVSAVRAEQSLVVEWSKSEGYLEGQNQRHSYEPETATLYYSAGFAERWRAGASLWSGDADKAIGEVGHRLEETHSGGSLYLNHRHGNWGMALAFSRSESELTVRSSRSSLAYQEESKGSDVNAFLDYLFAFERFDVVPALGLGYQQSELEAESELLLRGNLDIKDQQNEDQSGWYGAAELAVSTWFDLSDTVFLLPALQVGWTENISGESRYAASRLYSGQGRQRSLNINDSGELAEGSGYAGLSLALLIESWQVRISYSETLGQEVNTGTTGVELGLSF